MAEYIERGAVLKILQRYGCNNGSALGHHSGAVDLAEQEVKLIPTSDVAPVVHGRWEPRKDAPGFCNCSACHNCNVYDEWPNDEKWKYCPNCGAKMDLEGRPLDREKVRQMLAECPTETPLTKIEIPEE